KKVFFSEPEPQDNPFVFDHEEVLEVARDYLMTYMEEEIEKVIHDQQLLVFTYHTKMPFAREDDKKAFHLKELLYYVQKSIGMKVTDYEKAYLSFIFYNDIEDAIMRSVLRRTLFKAMPYSEWKIYMMFRKLETVLKVGETIVMTDLQELYDAYTCKKVWQYHMQV
ncbi:MAG: hypothetical protein RR817_06595, partial [Niameybacter sp.]